MGDKQNLKNDIKIGDKFGLWTVIGESKKPIHRIINTIFANVFAERLEIFKEAS